MKKWQKVMLAVGLLATMGMTAACGSGEDTKKTDKGENKLNLAVWNYDTAPEFQLLVEEFKKENPEIEINLIDFPSADSQTKLTTMLSSGEPLDVLGVQSIGSYGSFAYRDQLEDMTDHVKENYDLDAYNGSIDEYKTEDGKYYALPYRHDMYVMFYNKDLFDKAGLAYPDQITWEEYESLAKQLTDKENGIYGGYNHYWHALGLDMAAHQLDKDIFDTDYTYAKGHYDMLLRMQNEGTAMEYGAIKTTKTSYDSQFETGKAAMVPMGSWVASRFVDDVKNGKTDVNWGIASLPQEKAGDFTTMGKTTGFAINKKAPNKDAAYKFVDFAASKESAQKLAKIGTLPAYKDADVLDAYFTVEGLPNDEIARKAFEPKVVNEELPLHKDVATYDQIFNEEHDLIMNGEKEPEDALKEMARRIKDELN